LKDTDHIHGIVNLPLLYYTLQPHNIKWTHNAGTSAPSNSRGIIYVSSCSGTFIL